MKPKVQLALDLRDLPKALSIVNQTKAYVDIIEVGTLLALEAGMASVRQIRQANPEKVVLADIRIIKAGGKLAELAYGAGADSVTIISDASDDTFQAVIGQQKQSDNREVLIEINQSYSLEQLEKWRQWGLNQIIFHRSSEVLDHEEAWRQEDFDLIQSLHDKGFQVFVTGGISFEDIRLFQGVPVYGFIIGRSIWGSENPREAARRYQEEIEKYFEN